MLNNNNPLQSRSFWVVANLGGPKICTFALFSQNCPNGSAALCMKKHSKSYFFVTGAQFRLYSVPMDDNT